MPLGRHRGAAGLAVPVGIRLRFDRIIPLGACVAFWLGVLAILHPRAS